MKAEELKKEIEKITDFEKRIIEDREKVILLLSKGKIPKKFRDIYEQNLLENEVRLFNFKKGFQAGKLSSTERCLKMIEDKIDLYSKIKYNKKGYPSARINLTMLKGMKAELTQKIKNDGDETK